MQVEQKEDDNYKHFHLAKLVSNEIQTKNFNHVICAHIPKTTHYYVTFNIASFNLSYDLATLKDTEKTVKVVWLFNF